MNQQLCEFGPAASCLLLAHPFTTTPPDSPPAADKVDRQQSMAANNPATARGFIFQESLDTRTKEIRCDTTSYTKVVIDQTGNMLLLFR